MNFISNIWKKLTQKGTKETQINNSSITKKQHYIPIFILQHFTNSIKKMFEVLLTPDSKNQKIYPTNPRSSMCKKFAYEYNKLKPNTIENYFAKIDTDTAPIIRDLIKLIEKYKLKESKFSEIKNIIENLLPIFLIFYYRSNALLIEFSSINKENKIPSLSKKILDSNYIYELAETIKKCYKIAIIESDENFLLSDQFLSTATLKFNGQFFDISCRHIGLKDTLILIPISSRFYIAYWNTDNQFFINENELNFIKEKNIPLINRTIINNSYLKCVGAKQEKIHEVLNDYEWAFPSQIFTGGSPSGYHAGAIKKKEVFFYKEDAEIFELQHFGQFSRYKNLKRNDPCACGSKKKFKKCHETIFQKLEIISQSGKDGNKYIIPGARVIERPIENWSGYSKK